MTIKNLKSHFILSVYFYFNVVLYLVLYLLCLKVYKVYSSTIYLITIMFSTSFTISYKYKISLMSLKLRIRI